MATEIKTWEIIENELKPIDTSLADNNQKEKNLEQWIRTRPQILGDDIVIIGEQVQTKSGPLDFLGIDSSGNTIIVELKRNRLPREVVAQAFDYASDVATWDIEKLDEICVRHTDQNLEDLLTEKLGKIDLEEVTVNLNQRLLLVGFGMEESLNRIIDWLSAKFRVSINGVILNYVKTSSGDELLSRTVIIPEEVEKEISKKKKHTIPMSDQPGEYDEDKLRSLLINYLTNPNLVTTKRIKKVVLPALLENEKMTREQLKKEFVKKGVVENESQAGYFMANISGQLGHAWKDYLRQVIRYEYPNYNWEKDNFSIEPKYKDLVRSIIDELSDEETSS